MMTGEIVKEVFGGGFLESRLGLWSIKVLGCYCYSSSSPSFSLCSDFWQAFGRQS